MDESTKTKVYIVAVYDCAMAYGGPEEGGWWYDAGGLIRQVRQFRNESLASGYCQRLNHHLNSRKFGPNQGKREYHSVLSDGEYRAYCFEEYAPRGFPEKRPHYE